MFSGAGVRKRNRWDLVLGKVKEREKVRRMKEANVRKREAGYSKAPGGRVFRNLQDFFF